MYTESERDALRQELLQTAQADLRITGGAITGSFTAGKQDRWSDIDLAFGVRQASEIDSVLADFSQWMYSQQHAVAHVDVRVATWVYRVFLLPNTLQVDLAFAPAPDFGARAPTFRLQFGTAVTVPQIIIPPANEVIGYAWLYGIHVRACIARGKYWQAEHMLSAMREQVFILACLHHNLPTREGRGIDALPVEITTPLQAGLARSLDAQELARAFRVVTDALLREIATTDPDLAAHLEPTLRALNDTALAP